MARRPSMGLHLALSIGLMGGLALALALGTGEIYRRQAIETQRQATAQLLAVKVDDLLQELAHDTSQLLAGVQAERGFRQALRRGRRQALQQALAQQFHRYFVTTGRIALQGLFFLDSRLRPLTGTRGDETEVLPPHCPALVEEARSRSGARRMRPLSRLCPRDGVPRLAVLVPVGGLRLAGYLLALVDPVPKLLGLRQRLAMPISVHAGDGRLLARSEDWPSGREHLLTVTHRLGPPPAGEVHLAYDTQALDLRLTTVRRQVVLVALLLTALVALAALVLLRRSTLAPLEALAGQLRQVREDKTKLGESLPVQGSAEVAQLTRDFNDMSAELGVLYKTLESMAFTDALTGLPNRTLFYDRVQQCAQGVGRGHPGFALFIMDLDRFKNVNDTLGHHIGDQLLQEVSGRIRAALRSSDTMARLGGDEFAALLPSVQSREDAAVVARKVVKAIETPVNIDGRNLAVGASVGIALCPEHGRDSAELLQRADVAMYRAKQTGRDFAFYDSAEDPHSLFQLSLEADLRHALSQDELSLYYQPKLRLADGRPVGVEALVRWEHPERGFVPPDQFIAVAEQSSLIHPLTVWVLGTALRQCAAWHGAGRRLSVAVNLSARSLDDPDLVETVRTALEAAGLPADALVLELTESAVMADPVHALEVLQGLAALGVRLSVDDFGTGYSSLAYLKKLPVQEIKIDRSFVLDMEQDAGDAVIVQSIIDLAHNMGLAVVAEGVENETVSRRLAELGCDQAQGFHYCRPVPAEALARWLAETTPPPPRAAVT